MMNLPLTTPSMFALVDREDFPFVSEYNWNLNKKTGYVQRSERVGVKTVTITLSRVIMNAPDWIQVDHRNRIRTDCRKQNLRFADRHSNAWNRSKQKTPTSSRYKGVSWNRRLSKWTATISDPWAGKNLYLGLYTDESEAARAYNSAAAFFFGEFAALNETPK